MRTLFIVFIFGGATLATSLTATATTPAGVDPVAASFTRMLEHAPVTSAPPAPTVREDDPLYMRLAAVLWEHQHSQCAFVANQIAGVDRRTFAQ